MPIARKFEYPVLDIHELAAGKFSALMTRTTSRDLYDSHHLLTKSKLNNKKLRFTFIVYLSMTTIDPLSLSTDFIQYNTTDVRNRLLPLLRQKAINRSQSAIKSWAETLTQELQTEFNRLLPLNDNENELDRKSVV